jgi:anti-sigma factor RsiW
MTDVDDELSDELLGAYADGELDAATRARVERALARDRNATARLTAIREVTLLVRAATHAESVPAAQAPRPRTPQRAAAPRPRRIRHDWLQWRIAAAFMAGLIAMAAVLRINPIDTPAGVGWQRSALEFHDRYERAAASRSTIALDHLDPASRDFATAFADLVDFEPVIPDLSALDYRPVGARLLATPDGPATYVVYEAPNRPIVGYSMLESRMPARTEQALAGRNGIRIVSWGDGRFEYGLSSQLPGEDLSVLADTARSSVRSARERGSSL